MLASISATLISIYGVISDLMLRSHLNRRRDVATVDIITENIVQAHIDIYRAVEARNPDAADRVLRAHFAIGAEQRPYLDLGGQ